MFPHSFCLPVLSCLNQQIPRAPAALGSPSTAIRARKTRWVAPTGTANTSGYLNNRATWLEAAGDAVNVVASLLRRLLSLLAPLGRQDADGNTDVSLSTLSLVKVKSSAEFELFEVHTCALHVSGLVQPAVSPTCDVWIRGAESYAVCLDVPAVGGFD